MDFSPLKARDAVVAKAIRPHIGFRQDAWLRLKKNRAAMAGLGIIVLISLLAVLGPLLSPYSYSDQSLANANQPPSSAHWLGTDNLGRDLATRICYGARISLSIGIVASLINLGIGVLYGGISGYFGGRVDSVMMRIVDILYGIPLLAPICHIADGRFETGTDERFPGARPGLLAADGPHRPGSGVGTERAGICLGRPGPGRQPSPPDLRTPLAQQSRTDHYYVDLIHPGGDFHGSVSQFYRPGRIGADGQLGRAGFGRSRYVAILPVPTVIAGHRHQSDDAGVQLSWRRAA